MSSAQFSHNDVTLHYQLSGPEDGPLAVCLHGFPDSTQTFRHLAPALVQQGYRVAVPSMRGYFPSSTSSLGDYSIAALASDAIALHEHLGGDERAVLIGHDWGAAATYPALSAAPERWRRGVAMTVPPLMVMATAFRTYSQLKLSWYMFFFQQSTAADVVAADSYSFIDDLWRDWSPNFDFGPETSAVREALCDPEHLNAALGYYRAMTSFTLLNPDLQWIQNHVISTPPMPVLYLHAENDGCISQASASDPLPYLGAGSRYEVIKDAGHFLHLERPDAVNQLIIDFLAS
ncbi:MAG: alpha/beta hydrolase [Actinomycetota bacterium]